MDVDIQLPANPNAGDGSADVQFAEPTQFGLNAFAYRLQSPRGTSNSVSIYYAKAPVVVESKPNGTPAKAQKLSLPCEIAGQFHPRHGGSWYQFDARKGDAWTIEVFSQRLGLATDPYLLLQRVNRSADGKEQMIDVAEADDTPLESHHTLHESFLSLTSADPTMHFVAPVDGTYRVMVRDLYGQSGSNPQLIYRLAIHRPQPDFHPLVMEEAESDTDTTDRMNLWSAVVHPGRTAATDVLIKREDGFSGPVQVSVEGLPDSISCAGAIVGPGADTASLVFAAKEQPPARKDVKISGAKTNGKSTVTATKPAIHPWTGQLRIVAKAKIGDREVMHVAQVATSVWPEEKTTEQPVHFRLAPQFALATSGNSMPQIKIQLGDGKPVETAPGASVKIPVKFVRGENSAGGLQCWFAGACPGMNFSVLVAPPDSKDMAIIMNVTSQLPPGEYSLPLRAYATVTCRDNPEQADAATARMKEVAKVVADSVAVVKKTSAEQKLAERNADKADTAVRRALEAMGAAARTLHQSKERAKAAARDYAAVQKEAADSSARLMTADSAVTNADRRAADARPDQQAAAQKAQSAAIETARRARDDNRSIVVRRDALFALSQAAEAQRMTVQIEKASCDRKLADVIAVAKLATDRRVAARIAAADAVAKSRNADDENKPVAVWGARDIAFAAPQAYTIMYYSNPIVLKVEPAPLKISAAPPTSLKPGEKVELPISLERRFGFSGPVSAGLDLQPHVTGIHTAEVTVPAGQAKSKLLLTLDPNIKPGKYAVTLHAGMTFNGQASRLDRPLVLNVAPAATKVPVTKSAAAKATATKSAEPAKAPLKQTTSATKQ